MCRFLKQVHTLADKAEKSKCCNRHAAVVFDGSRVVIPPKCNLHGDGPYHAEAIALDYYLQQSKVGRL